MILPMGLGGGSPQSPAWAWKAMPDPKVLRGPRSMALRQRSVQREFGDAKSCTAAASTERLQAGLSVVPERPLASRPAPVENALRGRGVSWRSTTTPVTVPGWPGGCWMTRSEFTAGRPGDLAMAGTQWSTTAERFSGPMDLHDKREEAPGRDETPQSWLSGNVRFEAP